MEVKYFPQAEEDLRFWRLSGNKQAQKKISELIQDIKKTPFEGLGEPEGLKYNLSGFWSRRINKEHRLIYRIDEGLIKIYSMRGHYEM